MDIKKLLLGGLIGGISALIVGYLLFGIILADYMAENAAHTKEPDMVWLVAGHLVYGILMTYIFSKWAGIKTAITGAKAGALIALLGGLAFNWIWHGVSDMFPGGCVATLLDAAGGAVVWAIGGAAIGWFLGRGE
jgi:hypothetical protein